MKRIACILLFALASWTSRGADATNIFGLEEATTIATNDAVIINDVSDTTQSPGGSTKWATVWRLLTAWIGTYLQAWDADLDDLADGSLSGSKVGSGINGDNVTTGTLLDARIDSAITRDAEAAAAYQALHAQLTRISGIGTPAVNSIIKSVTGGWTNLLVGDVGQVLTVDSNTNVFWASPTGVDQGGNFTWTGTHDYTGATVSFGAASFTSIDTPIITVSNLGVLFANSIVVANSSSNLAAGTVQGDALAFSSGTLSAHANVELLADNGASGSGSFARTNALPSLIVTNLAVVTAITEGGNAVPNVSDNLGVFAATTSAQLRGVVSDEVGSGPAMFTRAGVIREIWIPANAMTPGSSDPPTATTNAWATATDGQVVETWDFSATATNSLYWTLTLPQAWDGSTVKAKIHWKQIAAEANTTNVWVFGGGSINDGETGGNTLGTTQTILDQGLNNTNQVAISAASAATTIGGSPSAGHMIWFTLKRHPGNSSDNMTVVSRLFGVHLQYTETTTEPSAW